MKTHIRILAFSMTCLLSSYLSAQDGYYDEEPRISFQTTLHNVRDIVKKDSDFNSMEAYASMEIDKSLEGFLQTPLMDKFKDLKIEAESLVITFKTRQQDFASEDINTIKGSYENFVTAYNKVLRQIKTDFMNRKQRKAISNNPNWYAATLELQFRNLEDKYTQNLLQEVANLTGSDDYSAFPLVALLGMIDLARDFVNHIARIKYEGKKIREQHLEQYFIQPYSMRHWRDLEVMHDSYQEQPYIESQANPFNDANEIRSPFEEVPDTTKHKKQK